MRLLLAILLAAQGLAMMPAMAADEGVDAETKQPTVPEILAEQRQINADLKAGDEKYLYLDPIRRRQVYGAQKKVFALLDGRDSLDGLGADQRIELFNALEQINANLTRREGDEMVCERATIAGTRRSQMVCMTKTERERRAKSAVDALMNRQACTEPGCLGD